MKKSKNGLGIGDYIGMILLFAVVVFIAYHIGTALLRGLRRIDKETEKMELRQLANMSKNETRTSSTFFLIAGRTTTTQSSPMKVRMMVSLGNNQFRYTEIDPLKYPFYIQIDNTIEEPYIKIRYIDGRAKKREASFILDVINGSNNSIVAMKKYKIYLFCPEKYLPEQLLSISIEN